MTRLILFVTFSLAVIGTISADEDKPIATPVPPRLYTIFKIDQTKGEVVGGCCTVRFMWQPNRIPVYETRVWSMPLASTDCFDVQGNKLTAEEIYKRLAVGDVVAVSADGGKVDPIFLKALAKDMLVFVSIDYAVNNVLASADPSGQSLKEVKPFGPRSR